MMVSGGPAHVKSMQKSGASDGVDNHGAAERPWVRGKGQQIATPRFSTFTYKIILTFLIPRNSFSRFYVSQSFLMSPYLSLFISGIVRWSVMVLVPNPSLNGSLDASV